MDHVSPDDRAVPRRPLAAMLRLVLIVVLALCALIAVSAQPASARPEQPIEPIEPEDPPDPGPGGSGINPQWADVVADPGFQAMMETAGQAQDAETMDGLRSLFSEPAAKGELANGVTGSESAAAYQEVLDLLVMTPDGGGAAAPQGPEAPSPEAPDAASATSPAYCSSSFRGAALLPEYPGPYGLFPANPLLNFCMPNGPYSADLCTVVPDRGLGVFDFRRACYMHDMAYFWTPVADRSVVDGQFFSDMISSCRAAHGWYSLRRYVCYAVGGAYYLGVRLFGGPGYNNIEDIPGYNKVLPPGQSIAQYPVFDRTGVTNCNQSSHAWLGFAYGSNLYYGQTVYPTGVVHQYTPVTFEFVTPGNGRTVAWHTTRAARSNCVVHHEDEAFNVSNLPTGQVDVYARYQRWESDGWVRVLVGSYQVSG